MTPETTNELLTEILWGGPLDAPRHAELRSTITQKAAASRYYRVLRIPTSSRLAVEGCHFDLLGKPSWRVVDAEIAAMVFETALVALSAKLPQNPSNAESFDLFEQQLKTQELLLAKKIPRVPASAQPDTSDVGLEARDLAGVPEDAELPFKTGEYAQKRLSDLGEAEFKKLIVGYRRACQDAKTPEARADKNAWLGRLLSWATYRNVRIPALGSD